MKKIPAWIRTVSVVTGLVTASSASATTGYFALGYGAKAMGLGGAVVSNPQDTATIAVNPAGITAIGERVDVGLRFFIPKREAELNTTAFACPVCEPIGFDVDDKSRRDLFLIPNFGFNLQLSDNLWFGFNNYGNGGLNSTYDRNIYNEAGTAMAYASGQATGTPTSPPEGAAFPFPDTGVLGVDLQQGIFAPTLAMKFREKHSVGVSLLIGVQRFSARGLGNFQCFTKTSATAQANIDSGACAPGGFQSLTPGFVASDGLTNNDSDWSFGAGARIGWMGEVHPRLTLGASYSSKIYMSEFDDYDELFAEDGDLDIPANFTLGATFKATPQLKVSFDFQQIQYEGVNSISNAGPVYLPGVGPVPPTLPVEGPTSPNNEWLGKDNGLGFGWEDINIYRLAAEYAYNSQWIFRAGYSWNDQPIPDSEVLFNILAPATIEQHATVGFTFTPDKQSEWNFAYMHAFEEEVKSAQTAFGVPGSIKMHQNSFDVSYSYKF